jgi:hypothetical protein
MTRNLGCLLILLAAVVPAAAQAPKAGEPIPLTVEPALLPSPGKYHLLPSFREQTPGNAAVLYYRAGAMLFEGDLLEKIRDSAWYMWLEVPLGDLPLKEAADKLQGVERFLQEIDRGSLCRSCNWQLESRPEGYGLLLPEIQGYRIVASILAVRARYHMRRGELTEALASLRTGYALGYHMGQGPSFIHMLVGAAMVTIMNGQLDLFVQQPGAPNLYWALATLPQPLFDGQAALREETFMVENGIPGFKDLEKGPVTLKQAQAIEQEILASLGRFGFRAPNNLERVGALGYRAAAYSAAKQALQEQGLPAEQVEAMPVFQVVVVDAVHRYRQAWEDYMQWIHVAHFNREPGFKKAYDQAKDAGIHLTRIVFGQALGDAREFIGPPAIEKVYNAFRRADRRFAALRCVEALRLYAATHEGHLPASLKDVTEVPVPDDPITHQPFTYEVKDDKARIASPATVGEQPYQVAKYEVTFRR